MSLLVWRGVEEWLAEACEVTLSGERLHARGVQLGAEPHPYRADNELTTGANWVTERLRVACGDLAFSPTTTSCRRAASPGSLSTT